jgi:hypothetical protein
MKPDLVWSAALGELQLQMTQATFDTWLRDSRFLKYEDDCFVIGVKTSYAKDWIENRLFTTIKRTMARLTGRPVDVQFCVMSQRLKESADVQSDEQQSETADAEGPGERASDGRPSEDGGEKLTIEAIYGEEREKLIKSKEGIFVLAYETKRWLPRLGSEYFTLIHVLRQTALEHAEDEEDKDDTISVPSVPLDGKELAIRMGVCERTIKNWLDVEEVPKQKGWFRIKPTKKATHNGEETEVVDPQRVALAEFIPRITYDSAGCRVIQVRMDTPLIPEDRARLDDMVRTRLSNAHTQSPADQIRGLVENLDLSVEDGRTVRSLVLPIAKEIAEFFSDEHSRKMYYNVLMALYEAKRMDLFLEAMELAMLDMYPGGNPGAAFVIAIQDLGSEEKVDIGIKAGDRD